jgi:hypothetical protein
MTAVRRRFRAGCLEFNGADGLDTKSKRPFSIQTVPLPKRPSSPLMIKSILNGGASRAQPTVAMAIVSSSPNAR